MTKILVDSELLEAAAESLAMFNKKLQPQVNGADESCFTIGLKQQVTFGQMVAAAQVHDNLRAALSAPQQEAVAWVRYSVGALPHFVPVINGSVTFDCPATEALEYEPLYRHPAPSVPEGWQLVPKEPTWEMQDAPEVRVDAPCIGCGNTQVGPFDCATIYNAMLSAAPKAPTTDDRKDAERYRWLCESWIVPYPSLWDNGVGFTCNTPSLQRSGRIDKPTLDAAIDAAIAAQKGEKE